MADEQPVVFVSAKQFSLANLRAKTGCSGACLLGIEGDTDSKITVEHNGQIKHFREDPPAVTNAIIAWLEGQH